MRKLVILAVSALLLTLGGAALAQEDPTEPQPLSEERITSTGNGYALSGVIASGGGTSSGGGYTLSGTVGQFSANPTAATGSGYSLLGGFWPRITAPPGSPFDVNGDGFISPVDAALVINRVGDPVTNSNRFADVDNDGDIDGNDVQAVLNRLGQIE